VAAPVVVSVVRGVGRVDCALKGVEAVDVEWVVAIVCDAAARLRSALGVST
jgi:hypothetical protein